MLTIKILLCQRVYICIYREIEHAEEGQCQGRTHNDLLYSYLFFVL